MNMKLWGKTPNHSQNDKPPLWKRCINYLLFGLFLIALFGIVIVVGSPNSEWFSNSQARDYVCDDDTYIWLCPDENGSIENGHAVILTMHVDREDYLDAVNNLQLRWPVFFQPASYSMIDPDNRYVQIIKEHILAETEGYTEYARALACLTFVQCAIYYSYDSVLFGVEEYWCTPTETLYLHQGDCEDTSILLASIYKAFGYECWLMDYPNHNAVNVKIGDNIYYCETSYESPHGFDCGNNNKTVEGVYGSELSIKDKIFYQIENIEFKYRAWIYRQFGI